MTNQYSGDMTAAILEACRRPYGLATAEINGYTVEQLGRMLQKLQKTGQVHRAKMGGKHGRYFDTPERAAEYAAQFAKGHHSEASRRKKSRLAGDRQLRVEDAFDRARAVNASNSALRKSNRCKADAVVPEGLVPVELPNTLGNKFDARPEEVPPLFSSLRPGQYIAPAPAWVQAVA